MGGVLTSAFNWRAIFWFLTILSGFSLLSFILFFHDTFRRGRSITYQNVIKQRRRAALRNSKQSARNDEPPYSDVEKNTELHKDTTLAANLERDLSLADVNPFKALGQFCDE